MLLDISFFFSLVTSNVAAQQKGKKREMVTGDTMTRSAATVKKQG